MVLQAEGTRLLHGGDYAFEEKYAEGQPSYRAAGQNKEPGPAWTYVEPGPLTQGWGRK